MSNIQLTTEQSNILDCVRDNLGKEPARQHEDLIQGLLILVFGPSAVLEYLEEETADGDTLTVEMCLGHMQCAVESNDSDDAHRGILSGGGDGEFVFHYYVDREVA